ncbi:glycoside hydrolase family 97 protein [Portibacter lacus]|uniref:Alpha-glucosidase n=1 Tax=Portibacter lacus TaxID=1099794 RepID=A0AA37ST60_9BACT|nr:glycoside hydrolase family 97 protein [Portibacter lacus]GLR20018.1 alpha-glucosidase [Portibacter lacus]
MNKIILLFLSLFAIVNSNAQILESAKTFSSPNEILSLTIHQKNDDLQLSIDYKGQTIKAILSDYGSTIGKIDTKIVNQPWTSIIGERAEIQNHFREITVPAKDKEGRNLLINCRLYDESLAFQYQYDEEQFKNTTIEGDPLLWTFDGNYKTWITERSQGEYHESSINEFKKNAERPILIQGGEDIFYAVGEAAVINYPRSKFQSSASADNSLSVVPESSIKLSVASYKSPWRFVIFGDSPGAILEKNYLLENLNDENQISDPSWIRPGKVIREVTLTTTGGIACVDFAVKNGLQYVEFDAGWYGNEYDNASDASTITIDPNRSKGPLDLHRVIKYAKERNIGIILYVNNRAMLKQLDQILPLYQSWGIAGVKYGFVNTGTQEYNAWLHDAVVKAANHKLLVDIHDDYRPTGFSRTYPNLLTQEGIRGDEESPSVEHSLYTIFIRGIAGAADNTNCYLAPRVVKIMGGKGAQMAKSIMIYSPWQFLYWYDRPMESPRKKGGAGSSESVLTPDIGYEFYADLPTTWDEIRVLNSSMGNYGTIARKKGDNWYIGSLNANVQRTIALDFSFLEPGSSYETVIYFQDDQALESNEIKRTYKEINSKSKFQLDLLANTGFAMVLKKK